MPRPQQVLNWNVLSKRAARIEQETETIQNQGMDIEDNDSDVEEELDGFLWKQMQENNGFLLSTGFKEEELWNFWCGLQPHLEAHRTRGPKPKIAPLDAMLALLMLYKLNWTLGELSTWLKVKETTLRGALERIRRPFLELLRQRWNPDKFRPKPLEGNYPYIGLIGDTTSMEVFRPRGRFEEAKIYWDGKNKIYALKKEVAILPYPPYFALFFQKGRVASMHDYSILQDTQASYSSFLKKTPREQIELGNDRDLRWGILFDKAYVGPEEDTPGLRRIFISKRPRNEAERTRNTQLSKIRVNIERWFGRLKQLWKFARDVYTHDHRFFDEHFEIMGLLTNEHIRVMELTAEDRSYYRAYLKERRSTAEEKLEKRRRQYAGYKERKQRRLCALE
jgi:hypothetical protein